MQAHGNPINAICSTIFPLTEEIVGIDAALTEALFVIAPPAVVIAPALLAAEPLLIHRLRRPRKLAVARSLGKRSVIIIEQSPALVTATVIAAALPAFAVVIACNVAVAARDELVLRLVQLARQVAPEIFGERAAARTADAIAAVQIDGKGDELALRFRRGSTQRHFRRLQLPDGFHDRLEDRNGDARAGRSAAERTPLAVGIVVADPDRDRDVVAEADEPGVVFFV